MNDLMNIEQFNIAIQENATMLITNVGIIWIN